MVRPLIICKDVKLIPGEEIVSNIIFYLRIRCWKKGQEESKIQKVIETVKFEIVKGERRELKG